ncbi:MAG TPA: hypothetical protein VHO47_01100 [Candidatus Babeliales bacterium]|nr:hypothetical protein [Candidatus Babeliales bacterium]
MEKILFSLLAILVANQLKCMQVIKVDGMDLEQIIAVSAAIHTIQEDGSNPLNLSAVNTFYDVCRHPGAEIEDPNILNILTANCLIPAGEKKVTAEVATIVQATILDDQSS